MCEINRLGVMIGYNINNVQVLGIIHYLRPIANVLIKYVKLLGYNSDFVNTVGLSTKVVGKAIIIYLIIK